MPPFPAPQRNHAESISRNGYGGRYRQSPPSPPSSGPPPEYAPPTWFDQHPSPSRETTEALWQPPLSEVRSSSSSSSHEEHQVSYRFPLRRRYVHHATERLQSREPWSVPKPKTLEKQEERVEKTVSTKGKKKKEGDPLSMLAKVSTTMVPPHKQKQRQQQAQDDEPQSDVASLSPRDRANGVTSPVQSKSGYRPNSVITPYNMTSARPSSANAMPKPITPTGPNGSYRPFYPGPPKPQNFGGSFAGPPAYPPMDERSPRYYGPPPQQRPNYSSGPSTSYFQPGHQGESRQGADSWDNGSNESPFYPRNPAIVERNSFDSAENTVGSGPRYEGDTYWHQGTPSVSPYRSHYDHTGQYGSSRWQYDGMPHHGPMFPHPTMPHVEDFSEQDRYPRHRAFAPYTYVQQPNLESKTILRKKFSWKHYPELERFLIENREEYLEHSSRNYTVAQKQFNNMLTERLLEVADNAGYAFDQDDFNFVAIRDRIRCYYKSYVQTVRKRGLPLPGTLGSSKKKKTSDENVEQSKDDKSDAKVKKEEA